MLLTDLGRPESDYCRKEMIIIYFDKFDERTRSKKKALQCICCFLSFDKTAWSATADLIIV